MAPIDFFLSVLIKREGPYETTAYRARLCWRGSAWFGSGAGAGRHGAGQHQYRHWRSATGPVYEVVPPPRAGYVWAPGYWDWDDHGHKHAWKQGHWVSERPGYVYEQPRWVRASNGWVLQPERWNRGQGRGDDDDQGHGHDHDRGRGGYHCPPGHAKKGEC
jgi:hypothetical protein